MPHGTFPIPPLPMRRTHSTFSTLLPQIYTLFPIAPRPASKYAILSASLQPPDNQPFTIQAFPRHLPNAPFPTTKRHLSTHDPCPFEAPSLTFRTSIPKPPQPDTCPTPAPPLAYGLSTRSQLASEPSKSQLPALCFTQNPGPTFPPNIFTLRSQSHRLYDSVECNGVGEDHVQYSATPVGLLTTISGKSRLAASRRGCV